MPNDSIWEEVFGRVDASGYLVPLYACLETLVLTIHECAMVHYSLNEARCAQRASALRAIRHAHFVWTSTGVTVQKEAKNENACLKQCYSHIKEQHSQNPRHHVANVNVLCDVSMFALPRCEDEDDNVAFRRKLHTGKETITTLQRTYRQGEQETNVRDFVLYHHGTYQEIKSITVQLYVYLLCALI